MQTQGARRRRGKWSEDEKRAFVARWEASGMHAREFGEREGVRPENLFRWRRTAAPDATTVRPTVTFSPVKVAEVEPVAAPLASGVALEVELPSGVRVRVYRGADMHTANQILSVLFGKRAC